MCTRFNSSLLEISAIAALALTGCDAGKVDAPQHTLLLSALHVAPTTARHGDTLTISFAASDQPAEDPTVSVDGQAATFLRVDELSYTYTYTYTYVVTGEESEGEVAVAVSAIGGDGVETSIAGSATLDFALPEVAAIAATPNPAKAGDTLAVVFDVSEPLQANPEVTVGSSAAAYLDLVGQTYTYSYPVTGAEQEGGSAIAIDGVDLAGNSGSGSGSVTLDVTEPTAASTFPAQGATSVGVSSTIRVTFSEPIAPRTIHNHVFMFDDLDSDGVWGQTSRESTIRATRSTRPTATPPTST